MFHLSLGFSLLITWPCSLSMEEVEFVFLPLESGLALGLALAKRMWWKRRFPAPSLWFRGPCMLLSQPQARLACWRTRHRQKSVVWAPANQPIAHCTHAWAQLRSPLPSPDSRTAWLTHLRLQSQEQMFTIVHSWGLVGGCLVAVSVAINNGHRQFWGTGSEP